MKEERQGEREIRKEKKWRRKRGGDTLIHCPVTIIGEFSVRNKINETIRFVGYIIDEKSIKI